MLKTFDTMTIDSFIVPIKTAKNKNLPVPEHPFKVKYIIIVVNSEIPKMGLDHASSYNG